MNLKLALPLITISTLSVMLSQLPATLAIPKVLNLTQMVDREDYLIVPGRVGKISRKTSKQDLVRLFGSTNLQDYIAHDPEGMGNYPATKVLIGGNLSLAVLWIDGRQQQASEVRVYDSRWHTAEGIQIHTSVNQLQRMFGQFRFSGFGWDYGGSLSSGNPKLEKYRKHYGLHIEIGLPDSRCPQRSQDCRAVMGDKELSSTDAAVNRLNAEIIFLWLDL